MNRVTRTAFLAKDEVHRAVSRLRDELAKAVPVGTFAEREAAMLVICGEAGRIFIKQELQFLADGVAERVVINGAEYRQHQAGTAVYWSLVGPVQVRRSTYRQVGVRNGATAVPLELLAYHRTRDAGAVVRRTGLRRARHAYARPAARIGVSGPLHPGRRLNASLNGLQCRLGPRCPSLSQSCARSKRCPKAFTVWCLGSIARRCRWPSREPPAPLARGSKSAVSRVSETHQHRSK